jgi:NAD(P)-dependent dehydrogenase (short-subunit alcohol dehydrogenase family)
MESLINRAIVITGAAGGVGSAVARRLAERGARLCLSDLGCDVDGNGSDPGPVEELGRELRSLGAKVVVDSGDVRAPSAIARLVERAEAELGGFDGIVHAVGIRRESTVLKCTDRDLDAVFDTHVRTSFAVVREAGERLVDAGRPGSIVLFSSPSAFFGAARQAATAASSAAIAALVRTAALELRKHGVRVNAVAPTARTRLTEDAPLFKSIRPESMGPEQVAPLVSFLLSDLAKDVSGEWIGAAGGRNYAIGARESTGAFLGAAHDELAIAAAFGDIVRG